MIRTIITPNTQIVTFNVPENYIGKELEIIAYEKFEGLHNEKPIKKTISFNAISLDTKNFKFNREDANER